MKRLLVIMLVAVSTAAIAPALAPSSALAADSPCNPNEPWPGSWWWANSQATAVTGTTKVLAVRHPYSFGSQAMLWSFTGDNYQRWIHDCVGYDAVAGRNNYQFRFAASTVYCLTREGTGWVVLRTCDASKPGQMWQRVPAGESFKSIRNPASNECLDIYQVQDGAEVYAEACSYTGTQRWS
jgi:hypothetical protein